MRSRRRRPIFENSTLSTRERGVSLSIYATKIINKCHKSPIDWDSQNFAVAKWT